MKSRLHSRRAFTLTEMLAVVLMIAVMGGVVFAVFVTNWEALEDQITRSDMWHEANAAVEVMTTDGRLAKSVTVVDDDGNGNQVADFFNRHDELIASYMISPDGRLLEQRDGGSQVLSSRIDAVRSQFVKDATTGSGVRVELTLTDQLIRRQISISTATEIFPRNINSPNIGEPSS